MAKLFSSALVLFRDRRGQDMIEYALLAACAIAIVVAGFLPPSDR